MELEGEGRKWLTTPSAKVNFLKERQIVEWSKSWGGKLEGKADGRRVPRENTFYWSLLGCVCANGPSPLNKTLGAKHVAFCRIKVISRSYTACIYWAFTWAPSVYNREKIPSKKEEQRFPSFWGDCKTSLFASFCIYLNPWKKVDANVVNLKGATTRRLERKIKKAQNNVSKNEKTWLLRAWSDRFENIKDGNKKWRKWKQ